MIMTSRINDFETREFFLKNRYFGAKSENIIFFEQAVLPAISAENGSILMEAPDRIVMAPNGNGAVFDAVNNNIAVQSIIKNVDYVQIIGVDNVLNRLLDPLFIGFTMKHNLQAAMKSCVKRDAKEPVGMVVKRCYAEGKSKYDIVEYSEVKDEDAQAIVPETG